jgi:hypothetical protein
MARYEDQLDEMEEKLKLARIQLKKAKQEAEEWRKIASALAHALALLDAKKPQPTWTKQYYAQWENKNKEWWNV